MNKRTESARICHNGASNPRRVAMALVEAIDECLAEGVMPDSDDAVLIIMEQLKHTVLTEDQEVDAVGHRVAHGGPNFGGPELITPTCPASART